MKRGAKTLQLVPHILGNEGDFIVDFGHTRHVGGRLFATLNRLTVPRCTFERYHPIVDLYFQEVDW